MARDTRPLVTLFSAPPAACWSLCCTADVFVYICTAVTATWWPLFCASRWGPRSATSRTRLRRPNTKMLTSTGERAGSWVGCSGTHSERASVAGSQSSLVDPAALPCLPSNTSPPESQLVPLGITADPMAACPSLSICGHVSCLPFAHLAPPPPPPAGRRMRTSTTSAAGSRQTWWRPAMPTLW